MNIGFNDFNVFVGFAVLMQIFIEIRTIEYPYHQWRYHIKNDETILMNTTAYRWRGTKVFVNRLHFSSDAAYDGFYHLTNISGWQMDDIRQTIQSNDHLVVIIHGFLDDAELPGWPVTLGDAIKHQRPGTAVFVVDWSDGAKNLNYHTVLENAIETAHKLTSFLREILPYRRPQIKVHIIGHGFGAQIGRQVVSDLQFFKIHRLTCLDPLKLEYENFDYGIREAEYTDVIHTDGYVNGFGDPRAFGTVDFYMNNHDRKTDDQPGCQKPAGINVRRFLNRVLNLVYPKDRIKLNRILVALKNSLCSHGRAVEYFLEAVMNPHCKFTGRSLEEFGKQRVLGLDTFNTIDHPPVVGLKVYADTNRSYPFCPHAMRPSIEIPRVEVDSRILVKGQEVLQYRIGK